MGDGKKEIKGILLFHCWWMYDEIFTPDQFLIQS